MTTSNQPVHGRISQGKKSTLTLFPTTCVSLTLPASPLTPNPHRPEARRKTTSVRSTTLNCLVPGKLTRENCLQRDYCALPQKQKEQDYLCQSPTDGTIAPVSSSTALLYYDRPKQDPKLLGPGKLTRENCLCEGLLSPVQKSTKRTLASQSRWAGLLRPSRAAAPCCVIRRNHEK